MYIYNPIGRSRCFVFDRQFRSCEVLIASKSKRTVTPFYVYVPTLALPLTGLSASIGSAKIWNLFWITTKSIIISEILYLCIQINKKAPWIRVLYIPHQSSLSCNARSCYSVWSMNTKRRHSNNKPKRWGLNGRSNGACAGIRFRWEEVITIRWTSWSSRWNEGKTRISNTCLSSDDRCVSLPKMLPTGYITITLQPPSIR